MRNIATATICIHLRFGEAAPGADGFGAAHRGGHGQAVECVGGQSTRCQEDSQLRLPAQLQDRIVPPLYSHHSCFDPHILQISLLCMQLVEALSFPNARANGPDASNPSIHVPRCCEVCMEHNEASVLQCLHLKNFGNYEGKVEEHTLRALLLNCASQMPMSARR